MSLTRRHQFRDPEVRRNLDLPGRRPVVGRSLAKVRLRTAAAAEWEA